jgi:exonuclease VII large subunit
MRPQLRHHKFNAEDVRLDPLTQGWLFTAYSALLKLNRKPKSRSARQALDAIRKQFDAAAPTLQRNALTTSNAKTDTEHFEKAAAELQPNAVPSAR